MRSRQKRLMTWLMAPLMVVLVAFIGTALARNYGAQQAAASLIEAERLIGMDVKSSQGEKLGEIDEIVLDRDRSRIVYAVVASGGFLGFGERSVAVPWSAFQMTASATSSDTGTTGSESTYGRPDSGSTGSTQPGSTGSQGSTQSQGSTGSQGSTTTQSQREGQASGNIGSVVGVERNEPYLWHGEFLVLDIDAESLKKAAFDQNGTWPASADPALFSGGAGMQSGNSDPNPGDTPGHEPGRNPGHEPGKSPGHDPNKSPGHAKHQPYEKSGQTGQTDTGASSSTRASSQTQGLLVTVPDDPDFWSYRLSKLINLDVRNTQGEDVGEIEKILVDAHEGRVAYATISTDTYLEEGDRLATVEWNTVTVDPANDRIMVEADRQTLSRLAFIEGQEQDPAFSGMASSSSAGTSTYGRPSGYATSSGSGTSTSTSSSNQLGAMQLADSDQLLGIDVKSRNGESLGEVEEIVLAREHEYIAYAVVALGGVLDSGEQKVAVPWQAFEVASNDSGAQSTGAGSTGTQQRQPSSMGDTDPKDKKNKKDKTHSQSPADTQKPDTSSSTQPSTTGTMGGRMASGAQQARIDHLILDVDKARLAQAAFDDDGTWPESANMELFGQRGMQRQGSSSGQTGSKSSSTGSSSDTEKQPNQGSTAARQYPQGSSSTGSTSSTATQQMGRTAMTAGERTTVPSDPNFWSYKLSKLKDLDVRTAQGEELGEIDKVLVDVREGRMAYVVVEAGSLLTSSSSTSGNTNVVVPWRVVSVSPSDEGLLIKADRATLQAAVIRGEEPNLNDPLIAQRIEAEFGGEISDESSQVFGRPATGSTTPGLERFGHLDFNQTQTMTGTVRSVDRARPDELMIVVDTGQGKTVNVFAGPSDYAQKQGMTFTPQTQITIVGVQAQTSATGTANQQPVFVAKEIRADGRTLMLIDSQGNPRWSSTNPNQKPTSSTDPSQSQSPSTMNKDDQNKGYGKAKGKDSEPGQVMGRPTTTTTTGLERFGHLDFNRTQTLTGTVRSVDRAKPGELMIVIDTGQGKTVNVYAGPSDYAQKQGMTFTPQTQVSIVGVQAQTSATGTGNQEPVFVAKEIRAGGRTLMLIDNQGNPRWSSTTPSQPTSSTDPSQSPSTMNKEDKHQGYGKGKDTSKDSEPGQVMGRPTTTTTPGYERFGHLDFNNTQTMSGTVRSVDRAKPGELMIVIDTAQGKTVNVFAGPSDYAQKQGMSFSPQTQVTVVGVPAQTSATGTGNQEPVFVAKEIRAEGRTLTLFDNQGNPRWSSSSTSQKPSDMNKDDMNKDDDKDKNKDD